MAIPMIMGMLGQRALEIADVYMIGHLGTIPLAAVGFFSALVTIPQVAGYGLCTAMHVCVSQALSSQATERANSLLRHGLLVIAIYGVGLGVVFSLWDGFLNHMGQEAAVIEIGRDYLKLLIWSTLPLLLFSVYRYYCEAHHWLWGPVFIMLGGCLLNILLNWLFIFGNWGAPEMGLTGAGLGTLLSRIAMMLFIAWVVIRSPRFAADMSVLKLWIVEKKRLAEVLHVGCGSAVQIIFEVGFFAFISIMMGWVSPVQLAAHTVAFNILTVIFMLPLGFGLAQSVRVGHALGDKDFDRVRLIGWSGLAFIVSLQGCMSIVLVLGHQWLPSLITQEAEVIRYASLFLLLAAIFQLFDGIQICMVSTLRGLSDVIIPSTLALFCYWGIGVVLAWYLAFPLEMGGEGMWLALSVGLGSAAVGMTLRFWWVSKRLGA